jgi:transmembrane sensor
MSEPDQSAQDRLFEEAAGWFARMRGPDAESRRAEFDAWLARGAANRAAYSRAAEVFAMGKVLGEDDGGQADRSPPRIATRIAAALGAVALLLAGSASWLALKSGWPNPPHLANRPGALQRSELAQISAAHAPRSVRLADGSTVKLEPATFIALDMGPAARRLTLARGSARFYVAHEARPFLVYAGGGSVAARGTVFDVALNRDRLVTVRLVEGVVEVRPPEPRPGHLPAAKPRLLHSGQSMSFAGAPQPAGRDGAGADVVSQTEESGSYDSISLAQLVRLADERSPRPIRLADPATGELRISGKFGIDDTDLLADRLAALLDLAVDRTNPREILLKPR